MANYAQTVNVIGCIKTTPTAAAFATTGLPLKLYRNHFGTLPLDISIPPCNLDIVAALTENRKAVTVAFVNPTENTEQVKLDFGRTKIKNKTKMWLIAHRDPEIYNEPGKKPSVAIQEKKMSFRNDIVNIPSYSIALYRFDIK